MKDWECNCGKYKRIRYRGVICDRCGVEVTQAKVRRERMGHIELAVPVSHIWFFKGVPSRIGHLLDMSMRDLERVLYYESYVVIDPGNTGLKEREILLTEDAVRRTVRRRLTERSRPRWAPRPSATCWPSSTWTSWPPSCAPWSRWRPRAQRKKETLKRLHIVEAFRQSGNKPEWMILDVVPVLPPDLRPLVPLEGGRFATCDLNDLYRRVINRNNRLKKLMEIKAPEVILRNEKRMLQEAVDALFDNGRRSPGGARPGEPAAQVALRHAQGQAGAVPPEPAGQARGLLRPLGHRGRPGAEAAPVRSAQDDGPGAVQAVHHQASSRTAGSSPPSRAPSAWWSGRRPEVWDILDEIIKDHPVLLNRAPTLHRLGIQAFEPVLVEGKAIRIHPLVCAAFNADFDGDQMAVHVPLSFEAQIESTRPDALRPTTSCRRPTGGRWPPPARTSCWAATT